MKARVRTAWLIGAVVGVLLAGCSTVGVQDEPTATEGERVRDVVLVTHESFALPKRLVKAWEKETGHKLVTRAAGDAGALTNKLVLTKDSPTGDVAFGVDNTFASRALEGGVFAEYGGDMPAGADAYALDAEGSERLVPVDSGNVCVNVDTAWFAAHDQEPPATLDDLTEPAYRNLFAVRAAEHAEFTTAMTERLAQAHLSQRELEGLIVQHETRAQRAESRLEAETEAHAATQGRVHQLEEAIAILRAEDDSVVELVSWDEQQAQKARQKAARQAPALKQA